MESVFSVSRDVYARQYQPASTQAHPQYPWQRRHTGPQPVVTQAHTESISNHSPNMVEGWKNQVDTLSRIIMRQEGHFLSLEDEVKTSKREIQRLGYLAEAKDHQIQRLEYQLAQTEAKNHQLAHEVLLLRHTQSGTMQTKPPPIGLSQGSCVPTQERVQASRGASNAQAEGGQRQGSHHSIKSEGDEGDSS